MTNKVKEINKKELSCESTIKQVCQWLKKNRIAHYALGDVLNLLLETDKFTTFCGKQFKGNIDEIFIIKDYCGYRDISKENIVLTIGYKESLIFGGRYIYPKDKGNIRIKELNC